MAREEYKESQSIHSMTTRQLRKYIADKAEEAQNRIDTTNMDDASQAYKDALYEITNRSHTKVKRSTSNMSKEEMREYAYLLRQFESLDTISEFAKSIEWKENEKRYKSFIEKQIEDDPKSPWKKYKNADGTISEEGFKEYRDYINFLRTMKDVREQYGYESLKTYYQNTSQSKDKNKRVHKVERLLYDVYKESEGKGWDKDRLNKEFNDRLADLDKPKTTKTSKPTKSTKKKSSKKSNKKAIKKAVKNVQKTARKAGTNKTAKPKSSNTIRASQGRKMREYGRVQR